MEEHANKLQQWTKISCNACNIFFELRYMGAILHQENRDATSSPTALKTNEWHLKNHNCSIYKWWIQMWFLYVIHGDISNGIWNVYIYISSIYIYPFQMVDLFNIVMLVFKGYSRYLLLRLITLRKNSALPQQPNGNDQNFGKLMAWNVRRRFWLIPAET